MSKDGRREKKEDSKTMRGIICQEEYFPNALSFGSQAGIVNLRGVKSLSLGARRFPFPVAQRSHRPHPPPSLIITVTVMLLVEKTLDLCGTACTNGTLACKV